MSKLDSIAQIGYIEHRQPPSPSLLPLPPAPTRSISMGTGRPSPTFMRDIRLPHVSSSEYASTIAPSASRSRVGVGMPKEPHPPIQHIEYSHSHSRSQSFPSPTSPTFPTFKAAMRSSAPHSDGDFLVLEDPPAHQWWRYRQALRPYAAEFAGTMMLVIFGDGVICQAVLSSDSRTTSSPKGDWTSICLGWGVGLAIGVWISAGISGAHLNPAVTLAQAVFRGFSWRKVPGYCGAQLFGAFIGAAILYGNYVHAIDIVEGGRGIRTLKTAGLFATYAQDYMTSVSCFFSEFLATAALVMGVFAFTDPKNNPAPTGLAPLAAFVLLIGITASLGWETGKFRMYPFDAPHSTFSFVRLRDKSRP
ncbi:hypothetical protein V5O48_010649 [Marasmius crinis-equi]|uniref:Uncharacterized protein n=1 Tax=Marasmius crinis-equi TaxID=585013 RepID=A0ABR3F888_9AGAR